MQASEIRHQNLLALLKQHLEEHPEEPQRGLLKRFAGRTGVSDRMLSHYKGGRKKIGAKVARRIEVNLGLSTGWLDRMHFGPNAVDEAELEYITAFLTLLRENPRVAYRLLDRLESLISQAKE
jgi:transcriptional regulator with XRE-family HTH domain